MQVLFAHLDEHGVQVGLRGGHLLLQAKRRHLVEDRAEVGVLEEVGHLAGREDVVDVLEEDLVGDLRAEGRIGGVAEERIDRQDEDLGAGCIVSVDEEWMERGRDE